MVSLKSEIDDLDSLLSLRSHELVQAQRRANELESQIDLLRSRSEAGDKNESSKLKKELEFRDHRIYKLEGDLDRLDARRREFLNLFEQREEDHVKKMERHLESLQKEVSRYRRERDDMREMYENANSQVSSLNKNCSHLQIMIDSLKSRIQLLENKRGKIDEALAQGLLKDDALLNELETIERAFQSLQEQNENLIKESSAKDTQLGTALAEKMKLEFKLSQALKEVEVASKNAAELDSLAIAKVNQCASREKVLLTNMANIEKDYTERGRQLEEYRKRISETTTVTEEQERTIRKLKGDLEEPIFVSLRRKYNDCVDDLTKLRADFDLMEKRYGSMKRRQQPGSTEVEEELVMYKKLLKCNSCHTREKNAVLAKCMHVFCRKCLEDRIETRQRKCPNCGEPFSATDIRTIYL